MNNTKPEDPLDYSLSGASLIYLLADIGFYWLLVIILETKCLKRLVRTCRKCCKRRNGYDNIPGESGSPLRLQMIGD